MFYASWINNLALSKRMRITAPINRELLRWQTNPFKLPCQIQTHWISFFKGLSIGWSPYQSKLKVTGKLFCPWYTPRSSPDTPNSDVMAPSVTMPSTNDQNVISLLLCNRARRIVNMSEWPCRCSINNLIYAIPLKLYAKETLFLTITCIPSDCMLNLSTSDDTYGRLVFLFFFSDNKQTW